MDYIKYLDSFVIKFHFYTNNQPNHQNIFGGIMTFIYVLVCIGIFIVFSYNDIYRLNPISSISEITNAKQRTVNLKNEKIWLPFRIVSDKYKYIDHRGKIYIFPYLVEGIYNNEIGMELKYHLLNYKFCNETSMAFKPDNYKIDVPLNELFCIDQEDILFGGNWNGNYINYLEINFFLCKDGIYFNSSDSRCSNVIKLFNNINSSLTLDFYYPVVQFQPADLETPISIIYKNFFYKLSAYSHKIEKIYIQEHILSDDRNLISTNYKNTSCWGTRTIYGDDYSIAIEKDPIIKDNYNQIFTMEIYMDYGLVYYTRKYNKVFYIISNVFPLFKLALYFIKKFTQHIKISITKRKLAGLIFEDKIYSNFSFLKSESINDNVGLSINKLNIKKDDSKNDLLKENNNIFEPKNPLNDLNMKNQKMISLKKFQKNKNTLSGKNLKIKSNISLTENNEVKKFSNKLFPLTNSKKKNALINESPNLNIQKKSKRSNEIFSFYYFFLDFIFDKLIYPNKFFCISKEYFTVYNFMCQIYDISTHIILFKQFNLLNNTLKKIYEKNGFCPAHPFKKININDTDLIEKLNKDLKNKKSILFSKNL